MVQVTQDEKQLIDYVEKQVCDYLCVPTQAIVNRDMTAQVSLARGYIFYILHTKYKLSISKLTIIYLRKKRVVFWNISKIKYLLKQRIYKEMYDNILSTLK